MSATLRSPIGQVGMNAGVDVRRRVLPGQRVGQRGDIPARQQGAGAGAPVVPDLRNAVGDHDTLETWQE